MFTIILPDHCLLHKLLHEHPTWLVKANVSVLFCAPHIRYVVLYLARNNFFQVGEAQ